MANRFPLIVDSSGTAAIKELASGDNLDLTGNGIVGAGTVALTNLTVGGAQGSDGQVLTSTGSGVQWENAASGGISDIVSDTSPQLGGNLDVNGQDIVTTSNGAIDLDPNGSGVVTFKGNATRGAGQFKLNCENNSHGIIIKGPPHSAAASYTLTLPNTDGSADQVLKTDGSGNLDWVDSGGGGGGAWTVVSSTTVSSAVSSVQITLSGSYTRYVIGWQGVNFGSTDSFVCFQFYVGTESSAHSVQYLRNGYGTTNGSFSVNQGGSTSSNTVYPQTVATVNSTDGSCSGQMEIHNISGMPAAYGYALTAEGGSEIGYTNFAVKLNGVSSGDTFGKVSLLPAGGNVEAGTFTLYGLALS